MSRRFSPDGHKCTVYKFFNENVNMIHEFNLFHEHCKLIADENHTIVAFSKKNISLIISVCDKLIETCGINCNPRKETYLWFVFCLVVSKSAKQ